MLPDSLEMYTPQNYVSSPRWHAPTSESPTFFAIEGLASLLGVLAIWQLRVDIILPVYFVLCSGAVVILIYRKKIVRLFKIRGATTLDSPQ